MVAQLLGDDHGGCGAHGERVLRDEGDVVEVGIGDLDRDLIAATVAVGSVAGGRVGAGGVTGSDLEMVAVDAGVDLVVEVGCEGCVGGASGADGAGGYDAGGAVRIAAAVAVDDGVAGGVAGVLVDDLVGVEAHDDADAAEDDCDEDDDGEGELDGDGAAFGVVGVRQGRCHCETPVVA